MFKGMWPPVYLHSAFLQIRNSACSGSMKAHTLMGLASWETAGFPPFEAQPHVGAAALAHLVSCIVPTSGSQEWTSPSPRPFSALDSQSLFSLAPWAPRPSERLLWGSLPGPLTVASLLPWTRWRGSAAPTARCHNGTHTSSTLDPLPSPHSSHRGGTCRCHGKWGLLANGGVSPVAQWERICLPMQETSVPSLGREDPLEEGKATHSSILAWEIPWTEEPGRLQSMVLQKSWRWLSDWTATGKQRETCLWLQRDRRRRRSRRRRGPPAHTASHSLQSSNTPFHPGVCVHPLGDRSMDATAWVQGERTQILTSFSNLNTSTPNGGSIRLAGWLRARKEKGTFWGSSEQGRQPLLLLRVGYKG